MIYTTKFFKIPMFHRFGYSGSAPTLLKGEQPKYIGTPGTTVWIRVGRNLYTNGTDGVNYEIPSLSTAVTQIRDSYQWTT